MIKKILESLARITSLVRSLFFSGLFTILPIALTIFIVSFSYNFIYRFFEPLRRIQPVLFQRIPGAEFIVATLAILLFGVILRVFIVHSVIHYFERLITKIPLVRIVYSSAKMLVDFFRVQKRSPGSRKVVLIQFPRKGNYHLAFLLDSAQDSYQKIIPAEQIKPGQKFVKVFMPNSPNPTTGYFFIVPEEDVVHTDITFEEAIKALVSCGLITPESFKKFTK